MELWSRFQSVSLPFNQLILMLACCFAIYHSQRMKLITFKIRQWWTVKHVDIHNTGQVGMTVRSSTIIVTNARVSCWEVPLLRKDVSCKFLQILNRWRYNLEERETCIITLKNVSGKSRVQVQDELAEPNGPRKRVHEFPQHFILKQDE